MIGQRDNCGFGVKTVTENCSMIKTLFRRYTGEHREFCEAPLPGYTGYVPRRREHDLGTRYATWTKDGFTDSLEMRNKQEGLATQAIDVTRHV